MTGKSISLDGSSFRGNRFFVLFGTATIEMVVSFLVTITDTVIVGHYVGAAGVSGVNIIAPLFAVISFIAEVNGTGTAFAYGRLIGEFRKDEADRVLGQGILTAAAVTAISLIAFFFLFSPYLDSMQLSAEVRTEAENYWKYEQYVLVLYPFCFLLTDLVYMEGDELLSNLSNIALIGGNVVFSIILCRRYGTAGASLGSLLGTSLCVLILCVHFLKKSNTLRPVLSFRYQVLREVITLSVTDSLPYLCWGLLDVCLIRLIVSRFSDAGLPILAMVINMLELTLIFDGIGEAMEPVAEIYMGEKNYSGESGLAGIGFRIAIAEGFLALELMFILAPIIPPMYGITDPELLSAAQSAVRTVSLALPFSSVLFLFSSQYRLIRKVSLSVVMTVCGQFLFVMIFAVLLTERMGIAGIWSSFSLSYLTVMILFGIFIFLRYRKLSFPWLCPEDETPYLNCSFILSRQNVIDACDRFTEFMKEHNVPEPVCLRARLIIEETGTLAFENNRTRESIAEYTVGITSDSVTVITRDTGRLSDMTQTDGDMDTLQEYVVGRLLSETADKQYLASAGFNRCYYEIPFRS